MSRGYTLPSRCRGTQLVHRYRFGSPAAMPDGDTILAIRAPGAEILLFDSRNMSLAASNRTVLLRLCSLVIVGGGGVGGAESL